MHTVGILAAILVTLNGEPVKDAQICGYKAAGIESPFQKFLSSNEIVCNAQLGPGLWNVFARRGNELVSARTLLIDARKPAVDLELRLEPAAIVTFANVPEHAHGVVYLTDTVSAFPANADGVALVPADRDLLPLLARDGAPIAVGEPLHLDPHAKRSVSLDPKARAIATWVSIASADLEALRTVRRKQPPQVATAKAKAVNPLRGTVVLDGAMQFVRDVPAGPVTIELSGVPWKRQVTSVDVPANGVAVTDAPLMLVPTSSAIVKWAARRNLVQLVEGRPLPCKSRAEARGYTEARPMVSLLCCREKVVGKREFPRTQQSGEVLFDDVSAGSYFVEFTFGDLPPVREPVKVERFEQKTIPIEVDYTTLFGRVTAGGAKIASRVRLSFGFVDDFYSDDDGEYTAVLAKPLTANRVISIRSCDGEVDGESIVDHDVLPNSRYDIDLPANLITVEAVDADTNAPVSGALVRYGAFRSDEMSSVYYFRLAYAPNDDGVNVHLRTGTDGRYVIRNLPADKTLRVCLEHDDYERTCAEPLKLTSTEEQTLRIAMKPRSGFSGRIAGVSEVVGGQLYWFANDGTETERTVVKDDGSFRFNRHHDAGEAVAFVSANHPLFAFTQADVAAGDPMIVTQPAAATRTFEIAIDNGQRDAIATIAVGNLVVPYPALAQHLALHGSQLDLRNGGPLIVPDILATAPLFTILGPPLSEVTQAMRMIDLFRLPQYRSLPRKPVP